MAQCINMLPSEQVKVLLGVLIRSGAAALRSLCNPATRIFYESKCELLEVLGTKTAGLRDVVSSYKLRNIMPSYTSRTGACSTACKR